MPTATIELDDAYFTKDSQTLTNEAIEEAKAGWWSESRKTLDERLAWWREARFGCFAHWGVYAVLQGAWRGEIFHGYAEHIQRHFMITQAEYREHVVEKFNPVNFDAEAWIKLLYETGIKSFAITAKHHDGFAMWDSKVSDYNIVKATPFARDPMPELKAACDKYGLKFGFYYSHAFDWGEEFGCGNDWEYENPGGDRMIKGGYEWWDAHPELRRPIVENYVNRKCIPQIIELMEGYQPDFMWFDTPPKLPFHENLRILKAIRETDPNVIVNHRLARLNHSPAGNFGDYLNCGDRAGEFFIREGDWESIPTTNESYGHSIHDKGHKPVDFFVQLLAKATSRGGNILLNLGPMANGELDPIDVNIFKGIGRWMKDNHQAIYGTGVAPLPLQNWGVTNCKGNTINLHIFNLPADGILPVAGLKSDPTSVTLLREGTPLSWQRTGDLDIELQLPDDIEHDVNTVVVLEFAAWPATDPVRILDQHETRLLTFDAERYAYPFDEETTAIAEPETEQEVDGEVVDDRRALVSLNKGPATGILTGDDTKLAYGDGKTILPRYFVWNWISTQQWLEWDLRITESSTVAVELRFVGGTPAAGGSYRLTIGDTQLEGAVERNLSGTVEVVHELGRVALKPGVVAIKLEALKIGHGEIMRPLELRLITTSQ